VCELVSDEPLAARLPVDMVGSEDRQALGFQRDLQVVVGDDGCVAGERVGPEQPWKTSSICTCRPRSCSARRRRDGGATMVTGRRPWADHSTYRPIWTVARYVDIGWGWS
jgi:hypothetical protein